MDNRECEKEFIRAYIEGDILTVKMCDLILKNRETQEQFASQAEVLKEQTQESIKLLREKLERLEKTGLPY